MFCSRAFLDRKEKKKDIQSRLDTKNCKSPDHGYKWAVGRDVRSWAINYRMRNKLRCLGHDSGGSFPHHYSPLGASSVALTCSVALTGSVALTAAWPSRVRWPLLSLREAMTSRSSNHLKE